jgi:hypothetical protein
MVGRPERRPPGGRNDGGSIVVNYEVFPKKEQTGQRKSPTRDAYSAA